MMQCDGFPNSRAAALDPPSGAETALKITNQDPSGYAGNAGSFLAGSGDGGNFPEPGLKVNVFYQQRKGVRLCMSNCREIEVAVLLPLSESYSTSSLSSTFGIDERLNGNSGIEVEGSSEKKLRANAKMDADQEHHTADLSLTENTKISSHDPSTLTKQPEAEQKDEAFRFLDLPLELRLKIYGYLLPARHHTVATQIPHNGSFYNTSTIPSHSAQSFYPFGISAPIQKLTTYKVLTGNFRNDFPGLSMFPEVLRVNKQIHEEAEGVLYGSKDAVWDFGTYVDAAIAFWGDRSVDARRSVKSIRVAREMPTWLGRNAYGNEREDASWVRFCDFVKQELKGLQTLDLTLWSSTGSAASFPTRIPGSQAQAEGERDEDEETERKRKEQEETEMKWREYNYTASLLSTPALRSARITWWGFNSEAGNGVEENGGASDRSWGGSKKGFDSWIATRMVGDELVKDRMVREGVVVEGVVVVRGGDA